MSTRSFFRPLRWLSMLAVFSMLVVELAAPLTASAFPVENTDIGVVTPVWVQIKEQIANAKESFTHEISMAAFLGLVNAVQSVTQRIAYDMAQRIVTGDQGQYPMFWEKGYGDHMKDVARDAADIWLDTVNRDGLSSLGLDLCKPINPLQFQLSFGLPSADMLKAKCTMKKVAENFEKTKDAFNTSVENFEHIRPIFNQNSNEIGMAFEAKNNYLDTKLAAESAAVLDRSEGGGIKPVKGKDGKIQTPAQAIKDAMSETNIVKMQLSGQKFTMGAFIGNAAWVGAKQLAAVTASTFVNTLITGAMGKLFNGMKSDSSDIGSSIDLVNPEAVANSNVATARLVFSDLLTPNLFSNERQDFVAELSSCPTPRGLWGCSMDDAFAGALRSAGESGAITVGRAAHVVLNGKPPMNPEFLHKDWELIPSADVKENQDPSCYQRAYCAANLAKLRYARIIPIGWELAANSPHNTKRNGKYVTLEQVIRGFNVCNDQGLADPQHPWCHLIDPNWVLTAPAFQCRVKGFGETVFPGSSNRLEECADAVSCLQSNDQGSCTGGYGYCMAEKPVWRFAGDACMDRFASCRTYSARDGQTVSFLRNTIDYGKCSAESVGCMWYATERDPKDKNGAAWVGDIEGKTGTRVYLDATAKPCDGGSEGCTKLLSIDVGKSALNLVKNSSFETIEKKDDPKSLVGWIDTTPNGGPAQTWNVSTSMQKDGVASFELPMLEAGQNGVSIESDPIAVEPLRNYTFSLFARSKDGKDAGKISAFVFLYSSHTPNGKNVSVSGVKKYFRSVTCNIPPALAKSAVGFVGVAEPAGEGDAWTRFICSFTSDEDARVGVVELRGYNVAVDALQLEEGENATAYVNGDAPDLKETFMKVAPDELACTGSKDDHALCGNFARVCKQTDAGCQGYRDKLNPTAPEIPASLSGRDLCPSTCAGYAEYRKQASAFDLTQNEDDRLNDPNDDTVANFVPSGAMMCTAEDLGCEEFTNMEAQAKGGEQKSYYNYVRACAKPADGGAETYFTWEGSDTTGYQLKTWSLVHDDATPAGPKLIQKAGPDSILKDPTECNALSWKVGSDPDCRQFYDADGNAFYAYLSQTIVSAEGCTTYRKNGASVADCTKTGGSFDQASGECRYNTLPTESRTCRKEAAGCRAYIGVTGRNTTEVVNEDFRSATNTKLFTGLTQLSDESVLVGDKSLKIMAQSGQSTTATEFPTTKYYLYSVSFWAKTAAAPDAKTQPVVLSVDGKKVASFKLDPEWRRYEFGPFVVNPKLPTASATAGTSTIMWDTLPSPSFIDQIRIERLNDVVYAVKNSWTVPVECDKTPEGVPQPQAMLGCREYYDRNQQSVFVRYFGSLCKEEAIGCKAFVDTRNSKDPYAQTFNVKGTNTAPSGNADAAFHQSLFLGDTSVTRQADRYVYLIDDPSKHCDASQMSCRAFGKPTYAQDQKGLTASSTFQTVYLIDDVSNYVDENGEPKMLCRKDELFCDQYSSGKTVAYFRNPIDHTCEWKDKVMLSKDPAKGIPADGEYTGWFHTGTTDPCYKDILSAGSTYLTQNAGDPNYTGWVSTCPIEQSECTEFRDPNDHTDPTHPTGKPYFFIKNSHLDLKSCGGQVDPLAGCVLFNDMSDSRSQYSTKATYAKSKSEDDTPQTPVDCVKDVDNPFCKGKGTCVALKNTSCTGDACTEHQAEKFIEQKIGADCSTDADCSYDDSKNPVDGFKVLGTCQKNDANVVMKVKLDRECAEWLGCSSAETVYDPAQQKYVDLCTSTSLCNKSKGATAGDFCGNYVDRSKENVLKPGVTIDEKVYASRKVGFGQIDYSGYTLPYQFQAMDIQNRKVGQELFALQPGVANKFAQDYRLAAAIASGTKAMDGSLLVKFFSKGADQMYPNFYLCQDTQNGRYGYWNSSESKNPTCYFAVDSLPVRTDIVKQQGDKVDPRNVQRLADSFSQSRDPKNDVNLQGAFPPPECKAYPEETAPFPAWYVKEWDTVKDPPTPKTKPSDYDSANYCEYGEDCACTYRKVRYGSTTKYFSPFGVAPATGLCVGGDRDGEACVPTTKSDMAKKKTGTDNQENDIECPGGGMCQTIDNVTVVRGQFGQCLQRDYTRNLGGDPSRHPCLVWNPNPITAGTYDPYHYAPTAGYNPPVGAGEYYCLSSAGAPIESVWSAASWTDVYDSTRPFDDGGNPFFYLPGNLSKFNYDRGYIAGRCQDQSDTCGNGEDDCNCHDGVSNEGSLAKSIDFRQDYSWAMSSFIKDGQCQQPLQSNSVQPHQYNACEYLKAGHGDLNEIQDENDPLLGDIEEYGRFQNLGMHIDGTTPDSGANDAPVIAQNCAANAAWKDYDAPRGNGVPGVWPLDGGNVDFNAGRWVMTGRGLGKTYMEYFFPVRPSGVAKWLNPQLTGTLSAEQLNDAVMERQFAQFLFFPKGVDEHTAACSLPYWYTDAQAPKDWRDPEEVKSLSQSVVSQFAQNFDGQLDRSKEGFVKDDEGNPIKVPCSGLNGEQSLYGGANSIVGAVNGDGMCYLKYWETNYRLEGTDTFQWANIDQSSSFWDRHGTYYAQQRNCSKSGFALRALFEDTNADENVVAPKDAKDMKLGGPFRFIGFWVTACTAGTDYESYLYLDLKVKHADICRQLAQVISPYSRESAAFADRVWSGGSFVMPVLGYTYANNYSPFGSALVNGVPGIEPMFQTGGPNTVVSKLHPPTFLGSGASFAAIRKIPTYNWAYLNNLFARVYRVYDYNDRAVSKKDYACLAGPNKGVACPNPDLGDISKEAAKDICGTGQGKCLSELAPAELKNETHFCNSLSGVNAGVTCGAGFETPSLDPICHNAALAKKPNGALVPLLGKCEVRTETGWQECKGTKGMYSKDCSNQAQKFNVQQAHAMNAFKCGAGTVVPGVGCSAPSDKSWDCPLEVKEQKDGCDKTAHVCKGFAGRCEQDSDCVFTWAQWWGVYDTGKVSTVEVFGASDDLNWLVKDQKNIEQYCTGIQSGIRAAACWMFRFSSQFEHADEWVKQGNPEYMKWGALFKWLEDPRLWNGGNGGGKTFPALIGTFYPQNGGSPTTVPLPVRVVEKANLNSGDGWHSNLFWGENASIGIDGKCDQTKMGQLCRNGQIPLLAAVSPPAMYLRFAPVAYVADALLSISWKEQVKRWPTPVSAVNGNYWNFNPMIPDPNGANGLTYVQNPNNGGYVYPGLCEGSAGSDIGKKLKQDMTLDAATGADSQFYLYRFPEYSSQVGLCKGGARNGQVCNGNTERFPDFCPAYDGVDVNKVYCGKVTLADDKTPVPDCKLQDAAGDPNTSDLDNDDNACTHSPGYTPRASLCGASGSTDKCLTSYDLTDKEASLKPTVPSPTDVTPGFHTPSHLGYSNKDISEQEYDYMSYYAPRPPTLAAPDLSHTCQAPGTCPISSVGTFALENQTAGQISFAGGQGQVDMRFYGWAAHEQSPLKAMFIDWGDGNKVTVDNARMKNHKPFCATEKECKDVPGLTCETNADCPAGAGACVAKGTCAQAPTQVCSSNADCEAKGKKGDVCRFRQFFGNSEDACEASFFQFTHAYSCLDKGNLPLCYTGDIQTPGSDIKRCSRNPDKTCTAQTDCGFGDQCIGGLAPTGGCFDPVAMTCRFTPKVMLKDNWNWCTGECRAGGNNVQLQDVADSKVRHEYGGCWDGTETYKNWKGDGQLIMSTSNSECSASFVSKDIRPWVVYQGAVNIGSAR